MGTYFTITAAQKLVFAQLITDMIESMGKDITIFYPGTMEDCENCTDDSIGNKGSTRYRTGGPIPFAHGLPCPVCGGDGQRTKTTTETGRFLCNWNLSDNYGNTKYVTVGNVRLPNGFMLVRGPIEYLVKFQSADFFVVNVMNAYRFKVDSEPFDPGNLVSEKFFALVAKRV